MGDNTAISWADATLPIVAGCDILSPACTNCYAMKTAAWLEGLGVDFYAGLTKPSNAGPVWNGAIKVAADEVFRKPLAWRRPRRIFITSMGDVGHPGVPLSALLRMFAVMVAAPHHSYLVLTKRIERLHRIISNPHTPYQVAVTMKEMGLPNIPVVWPLPQLWLGVTVEDQRRAEERLPILLDTPAAVRWVSNEPALGPVDFRRVALGGGVYLDALTGYHSTEGVIEGGFAGLVERGCALPALPSLPPRRPGLDWIISGGESHKQHDKARPYDLDWPLGVLGQTREVHGATAFWHKQTGNRPTWRGAPYPVRGKGDRMEDWPAELRVQELPHAARQRVAA